MMLFGCDLGRVGGELDERVAADQRAQHRRALLRVRVRDQVLAVALDARADDSARGRPACGSRGRG